MEHSLTAPIIQFEYETDAGTAVGPPIAKVISTAMMRPLREAYRTGTPWADRGRVIVLIEDPFGVVWPQPADGAL